MEFRQLEKEFKESVYQIRELIKYYEKSIIEDTKEKKELEKELKSLMVEYEKIKH